MADTTTVYFTEGDVTYEEGGIELAIRMAAAHGVGTTLKIWNGPAGGSPCLEFWCRDRRQLVEWLTFFHMQGGFTYAELEAMVNQRTVA